MNEPWIKASRSANGGQCVEMRSADQAVQVRDSKAQGSGPILTLSPASFGVWIERAKRGELDLLG